MSQDPGHINRATNNVSNIIKKLEEAKKGKKDASPMPISPSPDTFSTFSTLEGAGFKNLSPFSQNNDLTSLN
ncbi:MAG: hypothetical protein QNJ31_04935 [Candidatus Caenarcaniphilales bacterium]|nr:hypothetical protein [Candidatus Caenarcaniphilales bacterium]